MWKDKTELYFVLALALVMIFIGTVWSAVLILAAYLGTGASSFLMRLEVLGALPGFVCCCVAILVGILLLWILFSNPKPENKE